MSETATVLLVEDDAAILSGIHDLLRLTDFGYELNILKANDGAEGLSVLSRHVPDLIISDIMMPRLNGFEFLSRVRANPAWVHIPFLFLTAKGNRDEILEGRRSGAELYITKPFDGGELVELVQGQLDRARQLQEVQQHRYSALQNDLIQLLSHEFRTPLTYVTAYYDLLAHSVETAEDGAFLQQYLRGFKVGAVRLARLIDDLVKVIDIRTGRAAAMFQEEASPITNIAALLRAAGKPYESRKDVSIHYDIPNSLPTVFGVEEALSDALGRILDNAYKFTRMKDEGPRLMRISATVRNENLFITVEDTGIGFPAHVERQVFDLFFQHDRAKLEQQGSGAGLTIAQGIVALHGGKIEVASRVGAGSKFSIVLPMHGDRSRAAVDGDGLRGQATILLVEDDPHLLHGLRELLEINQRPYELTVLTAANGLQALAVLESHQPDLIISDVMMPIMGGYQLLQYVRANPAWLHVPFIFLTAKVEHADIHRGLRSGVDEYITKPYDVSELLSLVVTQLDRHFERLGAANQSFDSLKRSILSLLQPDLIGRLDLARQLSDRLDRIETEEGLRASLEEIQESSARLSRLVDDFMAMAEFKTGEAATAFAMRAAPLRGISLLAYEAAMAKRESAAEAGVNFRFRLDRNLPPVFCDRTMLLQCLERLVMIGVQLSQPGGTILVSSVNDRGRARLTFHVTGGRLSAAAARKIRQFLQSDAIDVLELAQYGPALTLVKNIIRLHRGRLAWEEVAKGEMKFHIWLPFHRTKAYAGSRLPIKE